MISYYRLQDEVISPPFVRSKEAFTTLIQRLESPSMISLVPRKGGGRRDDKLGR